MSLFYNRKRGPVSRALARISTALLKVQRGIARTNMFLTQLAVTQVLGEARLKRLLRAKWLAPQPRANGKVLCASQDVRAVIRRFERGEWLKPDTIEVARVRDSERRHGRAYVRKSADESVSDLNELRLDELRQWPLPKHREKAKFCQIFLPNFLYKTKRSLIEGGNHLDKTRESRELATRHRRSEDP